VQPAVLALPWQRCPFQLPGARPGRAGEVVLLELLRAGRAALHRRLVLDVGEERPGHAWEVDPAVLVEAAILGCDDGLLHPWVDLVAAHEYAALAAAQDCEARVPVGGVDVAVD